MRALRTLLAATGIAGLAPALALAQAPAPADLLKFQPSQKGVEYDVPGPKEIDACKAEIVTDPENPKRTIGYALRDGQNKLLRRFLNTRGKTALDQWSYYRDGFEVYRELDLDDNLTVDECRWLNAGGTRIATVAKGKVTGWKRITAEEASKVLVQALVSGDFDLLETVMATPEELAALGIPKAETERIAAEAGKRPSRLQELIPKLKGWTKQTVWQRFDGTMPHLIPADTGTGLKKDVLLFENAVIFAGPANGQGDPNAIAYLQAPEVVELGSTWKFVDLPRAIDPRDPGPIASGEGGIRASVFTRGVGAEPADQNPELVKLVEYDKKWQADLARGGKKDQARYYYGRVRVLREVAKAARSDEEKLVYDKQIADSLAAAYQTGYFPDGPKGLDALVAQGGKVASYAAFRKVLADYTVESEEPGANLMAVQKRMLDRLAAFLKDYPRSEEAPDALLQLASINEFNADEEKARTYYTELSQNFPETEPGKKAAGALRRLDLVGNSMKLKGEGLQDGAVDLAQYRGKTVLVTFWATWAEPVKRDLPELVKVYEKYHDKGFEIIGVSLDNERDKAAVKAFVAQKGLAWPQVFEPGGMDSRLANEYGIISLPTMILVDPQGKVLNRNIRMAAELDKQLEKVLGGKAPGVAFGNR